MKYTFLIKKIKNKVLVLTTISLLFLATLTGILQIYNLKKITSDDLKQLENTIRHDYDVNVKNQVENVVSLLGAIHKKHKEENDTINDPQEIATDLVREMRYGGNNYFWIDNKEGINIVYLGKDAEGQYRLDQVDAKGTSIFKIFLEKSLNGGGFTTYYFPRPGTKKAVPKRSYTAMFEPFDWVVGTGNYIDDIDIIINKQKKDNATQLKKTTIFTIIINALILIIFSVISAFVGKGISKPISKVVNALKKISQKQIDFEMTEERKDEIGELYKSVNEINKNFKEIITNISITANSVSSASNHLSSVSQQLSQSTNEQASTTEELSSSMEQMLSMINSNTENAVITGITSEKSANEMKKSNEIFMQTLKSVSEISEEITIISEVADKTDILSINAAIEAARAGEVGKGFAVVANEIRKLADKTKIASDKINQLSKTGQDISKIAGEKLAKIIPEIMKSAKLVNNIVSASKEQQSGVEMTNKSIQQLTEITNQNSASAEEMSASAEELSAQAEQLKELISVFKIESFEIE